MCRIALMVSLVNTTLHFWNKTTLCNASPFFNIWINSIWKQFIRILYLFRRAIYNLSFLSHTCLSKLCRPNKTNWKMLPFKKIIFKNVCKSDVIFTSLENLLEKPCGPGLCREECFFVLFCFVFNNIASILCFGMWYLSSSTKYQTHLTYTGWLRLNHWTARDISRLLIKILILTKI